MEKKKTFSGTGFLSLEVDYPTVLGFFNILNALQIAEMTLQMAEMTNTFLQV